ncbi:aminoglycoside phosphotransferase family protein [Paenibacillus sp. FSL K6-1096]|uniref:aminoglycoside phosphotransferase family protein n=1 Tax=Paenibacillus sp. FSL K6-1096 TaxID=2921460 RepID=UPI0030EB75CB
MKYRLGDIDWKEQSAEGEKLLRKADGAVLTSMQGGLEAEVQRVKLGDTELVLKSWNRESRPDIPLQYKVLERLYSQGCAVSNPYAWGVDAEGYHVLLMSYDGTPVRKVNAAGLAAIAHNLLNIHKLDLNTLDGVHVPSYEFIDYFFPEWGQQPEIRALAGKLIAQAEITPDRLIHGDYHLGNVLESAGQYTIIDWTNVQLGDPRYDIAWSILLLRVYAGERYAGIYQRAFLTSGSCTPAELVLFEALASLRWLQLHRTTGVPLHRNTLTVMRALMQQNVFLPDGLL